ncbi:MAG: serine hydrolase domain-containing protein [Thermomicrobiales bacterium]
MSFSIRSAFWAATLAVVVGLGIVGYRAAVGNEQDHLQQHLEAIHDAGATRVLALVTTRDGEPRVAFSDVDSEDGEPVLDQYPIGGSAETFVATVILRLVGEGKLSLDDTVEKHLPGVVSGSHDGSTITIRDLLRHTSGIYDYTLDADLELETAPADLVAAAMRHPAAFAPGTGWGYSHTNYLLAGMIIEAVTGTPWHQAVTDRIIEPLGLEQTVVGDAPEMTVQRWAGADGGIISTPEEVARFFGALLGGELLAAEQLAAMQETVPTEIGDDSRYGMGLVWRPLSCDGGYWGHGSSIPGYRSVTGFTEDAGRSVVLSNATVRVDEASDQAQEEASLGLIDTALCASD